MLTQAGLWWEGKYNNTGVRLLQNNFKREEAEELLPQVADRLRLCMRIGTYDLCPVTSKGNTFYVIVNDAGQVYLPFLDDNREGRTSDSSRIPVFKHCYSERQRRKMEQAERQSAQ